MRPKSFIFHIVQNFQMILWHTILVSRSVPHLFFDKCYYQGGFEQTLDSCHLLIQFDFKKRFFRIFSSWYYPLKTCKAPKPLDLGINLVSRSLESRPSPRYLSLELKIRLSNSIWRVIPSTCSELQDDLPFLIHEELQTLARTVEARGVLVF